MQLTLDKLAQADHHTVFSYCYMGYPSPCSIVSIISMLSLVAVLLYAGPPSNVPLLGANWVLSFSFPPLIPHCTSSFLFHFHLYFEVDTFPHVLVGWIGWILVVVIITFAFTFLSFFAFDATFDLFRPGCFLLL